jgi:diguanylate cyclase (GGDEF)-like protein
LITCSILFTLDMLGFVPAEADGLARARVQLSEVLAAQAAAAASRNDLGTIRVALEAARRREHELLSAGLRDADGRLLVVVGDHRELWSPDPEARPLATHVGIPLFAGDRRWGTLELRFDELGPPGWLGALWKRPALRLVLLMALAGFASYAIYMRRTLRYIDPSSVVPARVQAALDVMAEGVLLLDRGERIVLANTSIAGRLDRSVASLVGVKAADLGWKLPKTLEPARTFPWSDALRDSRASVSATLLLGARADEARTFVVKASPILDGWRRAKGAIATFDDITDLERNSARLEQALAELEKSRDEIRLQNDELGVLARSDPLTGLSNRRSFLENAEIAFETARRRKRELSCIMVDIDHFKKVNDNHGHSVGDQVIRRVAEALGAAGASPTGVCRYGGEEFCILLSEVGIDTAVEIAERIRHTIESPGFARIPVTASFGVSSLASGARTLNEIINQADEALYGSKKRGRNRVTPWEEVAAASA